MKYSNIVLNTQAGNCLLCSHAPCTKACKKGLDPARIIRALRFDNYTGATNLLPAINPCAECMEKDCLSACIRGKIDEPVNILKVMDCVSDIPKGSDEIADLTTEICGVKCENPFFLSSSVVGSNYEMVAKAFDMGWAGVAFKTIGMFVPDEVSPRFDRLKKENNPFIGFKNIEQISDHSLKENLGFFKELKKNYPEKIIIASIMGQNEEEWAKLATLCEQAGADIIECNFSCPQMVGEGLGSDIGTNPELVAQYTVATKKGTSLPVLAKMTPNITDMTVPAIAAVDAGADAIAAINTIKSIMNIDLQSFVSGPCVDGKSSVGGYSGKAVKPIALRFIHDMQNNEKLKNIPISGMGGIETWQDAAEFISMGCSTIQVTTAVMQYGYRIIDDLIDGLSHYMIANKIKSVSQILDKANKNIVPADDLNRSSISYPKIDRDKCISCGRCYLSCYDGGHQAIKQDKNNRPRLIPHKCVGCHLCATVCPVEAISPGKRVAKNK